MTTDQPTTTSVRDAILARCDELERLALNAGSGGAWAADGGRWEVDWTRRGRIGEVRVGPAGVASTVETLPPAAAHITTWGPAAALALVAGAREMVEIHAQVEGASADGDDPVIAVGCACGGATESLWGSCPTLAALARMLGVDHA